MDETDNSRMLSGIKAPASKVSGRIDNDSSSRKNVRLASSKRDINISKQNEPAQVIDNLNQYMLMADSPKMYLNENIISQPKLAGSTQSNKSGDENHHPDQQTNGRIDSSFMILN